MKRANYKILGFALALTAADCALAAFQPCTLNTWIGGGGAQALSTSYQSLASIGQNIAGGAIVGTQSQALAGFLQTIGTRPSAITPVPAPAPRYEVDDILAYPNPYRPNRGGLMHLAQLPANVTVEIYTLTGELVRTIETDGNGLALWDATNRDGDPVSSGVYYAFIKDGSSKHVTKLAVER